MFFNFFVQYLCCNCVFLCSTITIIIYVILCSDNIRNTLFNASSIFLKLLLVAANLCNFLFDGSNFYYMEKIISAVLSVLI